MIVWEGLFATACIKNRFGWLAIWNCELWVRLYTLSLVCLAFSPGQYARLLFFSLVKYSNILTISSFLHSGALLSASLTNTTVITPSNDSHDIIPRVDNLSFTYCPSKWPSLSSTNILWRSTSDVSISQPSISLPLSHSVLANTQSLVRLRSQCPAVIHTFNSTLR